MCLTWSSKKPGLWTVYSVFGLEFQSQEVRGHTKLLRSEVLTLLDAVSSSSVCCRDNRKDWYQSTIFEAITQQSIYFLKTRLVPVGLT